LTEVAMTMPGEIPIGERVRFYRSAQHKTQTVIAGLAGVSEDYLSKIERGDKTPTVGVLQRLAAALGVPVSVLLGEPAYTPDECVVHPIAPQLQAVLMSYGELGEAREPVAAAQLRVRVDEAWTLWQTSAQRFSVVSSLITPLTADVQHAVRAARGDAELSRQLAAIAADMYFLLRAFTKRIGRPDLSLLVADRGMVATDTADDPLRRYAAQWNLGQILLSQGESRGAMDVAAPAAERLEARLDELDDFRFGAMCGALWLITAIAASRMRDPWKARDVLQQHAAPIARNVPDSSNVLWTVFGPTNVDLHTLSVEMEAGESAEALRIAERIDVERAPSLERRTTFYIETARCYEQRRDDMGVLIHLQGAQETGPEDLKFNPMARTLARGLLKRSRSSIAPQTRRLAREIGILAA
jgi:transcriptional regulator with XRE-family HTH domain